MRTLQSIDVAKVLRTLADKIEEGKVIPHGVVVEENHLSLEFYELHRLDTAKGGGKAMTTARDKILDDVRRLVFEAMEETGQGIVGMHTLYGLPTAVGLLNGLAMREGRKTFAETQEEG